MMRLSNHLNRVEVSAKKARTFSRLKVNTFFEQFTFSSPAGSSVIFLASSFCRPASLAFNPVILLSS